MKEKCFAPLFYDGVRANENIIIIIINDNLFL